MMLSLFMRNKEFHVSHSDFAHMYKINESREMADNVPIFLKEVLDSVAFDQCDTILYSSGPASFTTARIMSSLIKGIAISRPELKFIGISNFLTYLYVASQTNASGLLAIPTMRGDYFAVAYKDEALEDVKLTDNLPDDVLLDNDRIFGLFNLASIQANTLNTNIMAINEKHIQYTLNISYGFTPEYRASAS